jgi:uncharacterized cupredoxin-like copper-binding protein
VILGVLGVILVVTGLGMAAGRVGRGDDKVTARRILDARAAAGEISSEERRVRLAVLDEGAGRIRSRWLPWLLASTGVALLVLPAILPAPAGSNAWWANHWTVMADHMGWSQANTTTTASAEPGAQEVTVEAGDLWFRPGSIELRRGETVNLTIRNTGSVFHDLTVTELDLQLDVESGDATTAALMIDTPGTYAFFCSVPGHAAAGMRGQLIVGRE